MSEVLALAPELQVTETVVSNHEIKDPTWGDELMNYVLANQDVVVICPWMGGSKVRLGEAMSTYSYPPNMTEKDVPTVMAVVSELLANRVLEQEESEEAEEQPEENETSQKEKAESPQKESDKNREKNTRQNQKTSIESPKVKPENIAEPAANVNQAGKPAEQRRPTAVEADEKLAPMSDGKSLMNKTVEGAIKAETVTKTEATDNSSRLSAETLKPASLRPTETVSASAGVPETTIKPSVDSEVSPSLTAGGNFAPNQGKPAAAADTEIMQPDLHLEISQAGMADPTESAEIEDKLEFPEVEILQELNAPLELIELTIEDETLQETLETEVPDYLVSEEDFIVLAEQENVLIDLDGDAIPQADEYFIIDTEEELALLPEDGSEPQIQIKIDIPEKLAPILLEVEEIENTLILIAQQVEDAEPETAEEANIILDEITELVAKLEQQSVEEFINESEAERELEELFTRLFEQLGINYTPDLIQSLVRLTIQRYPIERSEPPETDKEEPVPQDRGTHEIINKLIAFARSVKKAISNATAIGKSAMRLYTYDFPTELRKRLAA